jgi:diguanylate cyclase (GGDEF)-like protein/PAS domain S-box-containing protein
MLRVYNCIAIDHDLALVLVAAAICAFGVFTTMVVAGRAAGTSRRWLWSVLAGVCLSATIWSTHFVAMLAYLEGVAISYHPVLTIASFVLGGLLITAGVALGNHYRAHRDALISTGALVGAGVVALHYIGMAAVRLPGHLGYDADLVVASVVFSLGFGAAALYVGMAREGVKGRVGGALLLLLMTVSLHFTAMGAVNVVLDPLQPPLDPGISRGTLLIAVTLATVCVLAIAIVSAVVDQRMSTQMAADAERFRTLADGSFEGIVIHADGVVRDCNPAFRTIVGADVVQATPLSDYIPRPLLDEIMADPGTSREIQLIRNGGAALPVEICGRSMRLRDGSEGQLLAIRDISARKQAEARLNHLALHDQLTDLPNRRLFIELASKQVSLARRNGVQFAIHALDLDGFKLVNDMHGHEGGDALLAEVSRRLKDCLRNEDVVARFGGDEFAILETGTRQPADAMVVADRILEAIRAPIALRNTEVVISGSIGVAVFPDDGGTIDELLRNADTAMYRAKADGKGTYRFFEADMDAALVVRRKLESRLRRAITEQRLDVVYQPLVDSQTQAPLGFEALVRWHDEELGQVSPVQFIPVAEETGMIVQLGDFVLRRACADAAQWPAPLRVAVNLSPVQFRRPGLVQSVKDALADSGLPGSRLDLEITESTLIENREQVLAILQQLKAMQIHISMDDFGTGYSSLSYLQSFPFDKIKIDRVFVADVENSQRNSSIIEAVVAMGRSLSMKVVAEGVETAEQAALLGNMRCDELQGFLIARPMAAAEVMAFVAGHTPLKAAV